MNHDTIGVKLFLKYASVAPCLKPETFDMTKMAGEQSIDGRLPEITDHLKKLTPYPHLEAIAKLMGIDDPLDNRVVSSYWIGNPRLSAEHIHNSTTLIPALNQDPAVAARMKDNCLIHPGNVIAVNGDILTVSYNPLTFGEEKCSMELGAPQTILVKNEFVSPDDIKPNIFIAFHYLRAIEKISPQQYADLQQLTIEALKRLSSLCRTF